MEVPFSKKHGYGSQPKEIVVREGVTEYVRHYAIVDVIGGTLSGTTLRDIVCRIARAVPDPNNWSPGPVRGEIDELVSSCDWWLVYDIIEAIYKHLDKTFEFEKNSLSASKYAEKVNEMFIAQGIGWKLEDGEVVSRGADSFEEATVNAVETLAEAKRSTASERLREAFGDLSRRPQPDLAGAITHAAGAFEAVARDVTGDVKKTAGEILKGHKGLIPPPLDNIVSQSWGHASNIARHVQEGQVLSHEDVELLVGIFASACTYLSKKLPRGSKSPA